MGDVTRTTADDAQETAAASYGNSPHGHMGIVTGAGVPVRHRPVPADGQVHAMLATDIAGYSSASRDHETRLHMHNALYTMLGDALTAAGIPWDACYHEDRGDGALVLIPPEVPAVGIIDPFPVRLRALIRRYNHVSSEAARMQMRAAVHVGPVYSDAHGLVSDDITYLFRMLETRRLRRALADSSAELAMAVSRYVHETMVLRHPSLADPAQFTPLRGRVKRASINGWLYVPGSDQ